MMANFTLGILGSGQLGRMTIQAAADYGISCHVCVIRVYSRDFHTACHKTLFRAPLSPGRTCDDRGRRENQT